MANEIHAKYGTSTAVTVTLASLADATLVASTAVTGVTAPQIRVFCSVKTGTSPTANSLISVFMARGDDDGSEIYSGLQDSTLYEDALEFVAAQPVASTSDKVYHFEFVTDSPGPDFKLVFKNGTGAALFGSGHVVRYRSVTPEVQ
jgi:hypothetical protein